MPITTTEELLKDARKNRYAVGAFNAENMEIVQAIISAADEMHAPVIVQTTPGTIKYGSLKIFSSMIAAAAGATKVPVAIHLDHGDSFVTAVKALHDGYTSIMIDGSKLPLDENIAITRSVVDVCLPNGVPVEGELGRVGGKEDDMEASDCGYTDPEEALQFVAKTMVSSLAVGVGTAHGLYKLTPVLNKELINVLREKLEVPLVLHGGTGLPEDDVKDCIKRGISKVNFATELRICYTQAVKSYLADNPKAIDPKKYGEYARNAVKELVKKRILVCGCDNKA
ncbi:MAG: class II fructose-bisphosphate aldolase family protein [Deltaproteobacteria bacterium]|jgi:tagatose 1,6-diphosphate aldolase GatY/KbaY|nr:class II fructose-bisphosphate aldolase family protein [Deltaproteobacteria bacterium]